MTFWAKKLLCILAKMQRLGYLQGATVTKISFCLILLMYYPNEIILVCFVIYLWTLMALLILIQYYMKTSEDKAKGWLVGCAEGIPTLFSLKETPTKIWVLNLLACNCFLFDTVYIRCTDDGDLILMVYDFFCSRSVIEMNDCFAPLFLFCGFLTCSASQILSSWNNSL